MSMSYDQRLTVWGVHRDIGIGSPRWMSLTEARATAMANYKTARKGGDPVAQRRKAKIPTFAEAAYARSDLFDRCRGLMDAWAKYLSDCQTSVVPTRG